MSPNQYTLVPLATVNFTDFDCVTALRVTSYSHENQGHVRDEPYVSNTKIETTVHADDRSSRTSTARVSIFTTSVTRQRYYYRPPGSDRLYPPNYAFSVVTTGRSKVMPVVVLNVSSNSINSTCRRDWFSSRALKGKGLANVNLDPSYMT